MDLYGHIGWMRLCQAGSRKGDCYVKVSQQNASTPDARSSKILVEKFSDEFSKVSELRVRTFSSKQKQSGLVELVGRFNFDLLEVAERRSTWTPPPAAADVALEELQKARIKRQDSTYFFVCPRLMSPKWKKQLWKMADLIISIPPGTPSWPATMYEPLTIGFVFPFLCSRPWQLKGTPKMFHMARQVQRMFKDENVDSGDFLRKLILECSRFRTMPQNVVQQMLFFRSDGEFSCESPRKRGGQKRKRPAGLGKAEESLGKQAKSPGCFLAGKKR
jgi:hypothetical protein